MKTYSNENLDRSVLFEHLPDLTQQALTLQKCTLCDEPLDERPIEFVECYSGEVRWWHFNTDFRGNHEPFDCKKLSTK